MSSLLDRLESDYKTAMKAQDRLRIDTIRLVKAAIQLVAIEKQKTLEDAEVIQVLSQQAKQRRETIEAAKQNGRQDVLTQATNELALLTSYLPQALSEEALKQLIDEEGNPELKLRVFVTGGGCSGFQYGFTFDEITNEDDTVMSKNGVSLLIDAMSYQYLVGAEIDYKEDLQGAQFVIKNPNATTTCGCGSSFS